jgi:hypothetical protein
MRDAMRIARCDDQSGVVRLLYAPGNLGVGIRGRVGLLLTRQRQHDSSTQVARLGRRIRTTVGRNFDTCPLAPQVHARRHLHDIDDERAADPRGGFEEIDRAVAADNELRVGDAAMQAE